MKFLLLLLIFPFLSASECSKKKKKPVVVTTPDLVVIARDSIPVCVRKMIDVQQKEIPPNAPVQIEEYVYKGKTVYLFTAQCCDQYNVLYDDSCKMICAPSGGFIGKGDGKCEDFLKMARLVKLIWKESPK